jgi:hypothetical protein
MSYAGHLKRLNQEELWALHLSVSEVLQHKIEQEKRRLEDRLRSLHGPYSSQSFRNIEIQVPPHRPGRAGESSHGGWLLS